jgi:hypothetical protein
MLLTRRFLDLPNWRRSAELAVGFSVISLASFPPILLSIFATTLFYFVVMVIHRDGHSLMERRSIIALRFVVGAALAMGLVAFYYIPAAVLIRSAPQVGKAYGTAAILSLEPVCLYQLLSSTIMRGEAVYANPTMPNPSLQHLYYVGVAGTLLALFAGPRAQGKRGPLYAVACSAAALVALKLFGIPPVQWLAYLPGFGQIHFAAYYGIALAFLVSLLGAMGLRNVLAGGLSSSRMAFSILAFTIFLALAWQIAVQRGVFAKKGGLLWFAGYCQLWLILALVVLCLLASRHRRTPEASLAIALSLIGVLSLEGTLNAYYPRQNRWDVWRHPVPYVQYLMRQGLARVLGFGALTANTGSAFRIVELDSLMTFNPPRVFEFYKKYLAPSSYLFLREATGLPPEPVLDCAGVELVAVRHAAPAVISDAVSRGYEFVFDDGYVKVFRRRSSPRYYFTSEYRVVPTGRALAEIDAARSAHELVLEALPSFSPTRNDPGDSAPALIRFLRNSYALEFDAPRVGLIYCSESYCAGWKALVNGREVPIVPANYAFRAIEVPKGHVSVVFSYSPPGLRVGTWISAASAVLISLLFSRKVPT